MEAEFPVDELLVELERRGAFTGKTAVVRVAMRRIHLEVTYLTTQTIEVPSLVRKALRPPEFLSSGFDSSEIDARLQWEAVEYEPRQMKGNKSWEWDGTRLIRRIVSDHYYPVVPSGVKSTLYNILNKTRSGIKEIERDIAAEEEFLEKHWSSRVKNVYNAEGLPDFLDEDETADVNIMVAQVVLSRLRDDGDTVELTELLDVVLDAIRPILTVNREMIWNGIKRTWKKIYPRVIRVEAVVAECFGSQLLGFPTFAALVNPRSLREAFVARDVPGVVDPDVVNEEVAFEEHLLDVRRVVSTTPHTHLYEHEQGWEQGVLMNPFTQAELRALPQPKEVHELLRRVLS